MYPLRKTTQSELPILLGILFPIISQSIARGSPNISIMDISIKIKIFLLFIIITLLKYFTIIMIYQIKYTIFAYERVSIYKNNLNTFLRM